MRISKNVESKCHLFKIMWGVSESREPIKGEFAKKLIKEVQRMLKLKKEGKDLHFENKDREICHNIIREYDN